jgi:hypothetical protein
MLLPPTVETASADHFAVGAVSSCVPHPGNRLNLLFTGDRVSGIRDLGLGLDLDRLGGPFG